MPKFEVTIEREVPSYRERSTIIVEADSADDIEELLELEYIEEECDLDWELVMEGHGGHPCEYSMRDIDVVEDEDLSVDFYLGKENEQN